MIPASEVAYIVVDSLSGLVCVTVAALVLIPTPRRRVNLALASYLVLTGANFLATAAIHAQWGPFATLNADRLQTITGIAAPFFYVLFFALAIDSPIVRPLRYPVAQMALAGVGTFLVVGPLLVPTLYGIPGPTRIQYTGPLSHLLEPWFLWCIVASLALSTVACLDAWRRAPRGSLARRRARAYASAFVLLDVASVFGYAVGNIVVLPDAWTHFFVDGVAMVLAIVFNVLFTRALLRDQLFDFDLKLKWTLKRGTLVGAFVVVFVIGTALAEQYLQQFGWIVGGLAVGALLLALRPIERAIDRLADRAMPRTTGSAEYVAERKHEIYRAALEDSLADGAVTAKERAVLVRLATNLELDGNDAMRIESEVLASRVEASS
jgi:hypothetical protein